MTKKLILIPAGTFLFGLFLGGATTPTSTPTAALTVPAPVQTVTRVVTPQACITALDLTAQFATIVGNEHEAFGTAAQRAQTTGDSTTFLATIAADMDNMTTQTQALTPKMHDAAMACRTANGS